MRNLVWATSKHDVYFMTNASVNHWSSTSRALTEVLNFSGHVAPDEVLLSLCLHFLNIKQIVKDFFFINFFCLYLWFYLNFNLSSSDKLCKNASALVHDIFVGLLEAQWELARRIYTNSNKYNIRQTQFAGCWGLSRRTHL